MVKGNLLVIEVGVVTGFGSSPQGCCWLHWLKREGQNINHDQSKYNRNSYSTIHLYVLA